MKRITIMNKAIHHLKIGLCTILITIISGVSQSSYGALSIPEEPLIIGSGPQPNIFFALDDSGSMAFALLTSNNGGTFVYPVSGFRGNVELYYTLPAPNNLDPFDRVVPFEEWLEDRGDSTLGVWRARNSDYNRVYYNPAVQYTPWFGKDEDGNEYTDANPSAARYNPYDPDVGTINLTTDRTDSYVSYHPEIFDGNSLFSTSSTYYPAFYYTWDEKVAGEEPDPDDDHTKIEIKPENAPFSGGPNRTDCSNPNACTYTEEIQNFANWFVYYRLRDFTLKRATTELVNDSEAYMGLATLHDNNDVGTPVRDMSDQDNKSTLLQRVSQMQPVGGTPLRDLLDNVGKYFDDTDGSNSPSSLGFNESSPILSESEGGACQQNFTILMSDGFWNFEHSGTGNTDGDNNTDFDGGPHADDLSNTLADIAMHYYENDLSTLPNGVPIIEDVDENDAQHMVTYTVAFGLTGNDLTTPENHDNATPAPPWPNNIDKDSKETLDDMQHAAFNGRGLFLNAADPQELINSLADSIADIEGRTTFSASSVAINSSVLRTSSLLFQARFDTSDYSGELTAFSLNSDGTINEEVWTASDNLPSENSRNIFTTVEKNNSPTAIEFVSNDADLQSAIGTLDVDGSTINSNTLIEYIRGNQGQEQQNNNGELRDRDNLLGDIVNSSPLSIGQSNQLYDLLPGTEGDTYSAYVTEKFNRFTDNNGDPFSFVYVGSNDGMLHAFDSRDGTESFAYIPSMVHDKLKNLAKPDYGHKFFVDATAGASDAYIDDNWSTIISGGLGAGGKGLYALDITTPGSFSESDVLWEFTPDDDSDIGYIYHQPQVVRLATGQWGVIVGNGFNSSSDTAQLFILNASDGSIIAKLDTEVGSASNTNGLSMPFILDSNTDLIADTIYAGDLHGNMWKFDISSSNTNQWEIAYGQGNNTDPLYTAEDSNGNAQPITTKPVVTTHPDGGFMVLFGSGKYIEKSDNSIPNNPQVQTFYGIRDNQSAVGSGRNSLQEQTILAEPATTDAAGNVTGQARITSDTTVDYANKDGWYIDLVSPINGTQAEQVIANPLTRFERVIFTTFIPGVSPCDRGGESVIMELDAVSGARLENSVFDYNDDGIIDASDYVDDGSGNSVPGSGIFIPPTIASPAVISAEDASKEYKQTSGIETDITTTQESTTGASVGRQSWRQIR